MIANRAPIRDLAVNRATFQSPGDPVPDGDGGYTQGWVDLDPPSLDVQIEPATARVLERVASGSVVATASHVITARYHPGVTTKTRVTFGAREFHVNGVQNVDELGIDMKLVCTEIVA